MAMRKARRSKPRVRYDLRVKEGGRYVPLYKSRQVAKLRRMSGAKLFSKSTKAPKLYGVKISGRRIVRARKL